MMKTKIIRLRLGNDICRKERKRLVFIQKDYHYNSIFDEQ